ncbi:hypothetical protein Avbf_02885 [Armadillidium vulgare]|nr:hypothetical protein Avbf_02885 [Armadillidium vulgare]
MLHGRAERGPELRTLDQASARQADSETATWLSLYCVSTSSPTRQSLRGFSAGEFVVSSVKGVCGQKGALVSASATRLRSLRKQTSLRNLLSGSLSGWRLLHDVQERAPNSELSTPALQGRRTTGGNLAVLLLRLPTGFFLSLTRKSLRGFSARVRCVERKGVYGQRVLSSQLLPLAYARSGSNLLRNLLSGSLSAGGCCTDVQEGPRTPNSRPSFCKAGGQRDGNFGCSSTASPQSSPPHESLEIDLRENLALIASLLEGCDASHAHLPPRERRIPLRPFRELGAILQTLTFTRFAKDRRASSEFLGRQFVVSSVKAFVDRRCSRPSFCPSPTLAPKQPLYETSFLAACLLAAAARTCKRGPRTPNSRPSSARQADNGRQLWLFFYCVSTSSPPPRRASNSSKDPSETGVFSNLTFYALRKDRRASSGFLGRRSCVERKGVCGQKGALVSASASPTLAPEATSLRNLSFSQLFLLAAAAWTCREGPRTPNSRPSSARQADSETQLGSPCTASPRPLLLENPSEDSQPRVRCVEPLSAGVLHGRAERAPNSELSTKLCKAGGQRDATCLSLYCVSTSSPIASPRGFSREFVCVERKGVVDRRVLSSQLLPLAYARSGATSLRNLLSGQLVCWRCCADVQRGPRTPNSRQALQAGGQRTQLGSSSTARCGQKGALVSASALAYARSGSNLSTKPLLAALSAGGAARTCREGPELRTLDQLCKAGGQRTQLGSPCTASPRPLLLASPSEDSQREFVVSSLFLLAAAAWTCREGPELRTLDQALQAGGQRDANLALPCTDVPRPLLSQVLRGFSSREFVVSRNVAMCGQKVSRAQLLPLARSLGETLSTKPPFWQLVCWRLLQECKRGAPNFELSTKLARQADNGDATLASLYCRASNSSKDPSETGAILQTLTFYALRQRQKASSEVSRSTVRCVERKGVCGQKVLSSQLLPSPTLAPEATSLRKLLSGSLSAGGCCRTCKRGPRTPNSRPSSARQADNGTQLWLFFYCVSTSSPPHESLEIDLRGNLALIASPNRGLGRVSRPPSPRERRIPLRTLPKLALFPNFDFLRASPKTEGLVRGFSVDCSLCRAKGVCGQKGALVSASALAYARSEATSLRNLLSGSLSAGGCCTDVQERAPNSEPRPSSARQADNGTQFGCSFTASSRPLLLTSPRK